MNTTTRAAIATQALNLASMRTSAELCIADAIELAARGNAAAAEARMERAAQYIWGFARPAAW
jgi:hypothetical protein